MARSQRSVSAAVVVVVALAGLLVTGRWLQPRLEGRMPAAPTTRPLPTSPAPTSPTVTTSRPAEPSSVTRVVATSSQVDAVAVTRQAVWLAVGGVVLRVDPATGRALAVPGVDAGEPPVVDLTAGAGAVWAVCCDGRVRRGRLTRLDPASGRVIAAVGLPGRPLAVGAGLGAVWVRGAEGWLWRVNPAGDRQTGAIRLPTAPDQTEAPGAVVVAEEAVWVSDPEAAVVRRVDVLSRTADQWEADGRDLVATPGGTVWATSDTRLLGLGGPQVRGPRRSLHELDTDRITAAAAAADGGLWLGTPHGL